MSMLDWRLRHSVAALPTGTNVDPNNRSTWTYANEPGVVAYVLASGPRRRLFTSHGTLRGFDLGSSHEFHSDQTIRTFGFWRIVGIITIGEHAVHAEGEVLTKRKVPHWVCK